MIGADYHIHTHYVGCANETMTIPAILERCKALGRTSIAITDHRDDDGRRDKNQLIRDELERTDPGDLEVFFGCELNIQNLDADVVVDDQMKRDESFEIIIGGSHSTWYEIGSATVPEIIERQCDLMCKAAANPMLDVLVHPWWFGDGEFNEQFKGEFTSLEMVPDEWTRKLAEICVENDTAIEVNTCASLLYGPTDNAFKESYKAYLARFVELGCSVSLGTDAHDINGLDTVTVGEKAIEELGIPEERIWHPRVEAKVTGSRLGEE
jgi:histidinol phosphatase-like PHP family hydrolase